MWQVERFIDQVTTSEVALTGLGFVTLNRRLVLTVSAGELERVLYLLAERNCYVTVLEVCVPSPVL
jgi:hypothetical protein